MLKTLIHCNLWHLLKIIFVALNFDECSRERDLQSQYNLYVQFIQLMQHTLQEMLFDGKYISR